MMTDQIYGARGLTKPETAAEKRRRLHREAAEDVKAYAAALREAKERYKHYDAAMTEEQQAPQQIEERSDTTDQQVDPLA